MKIAMCFFLLILGNLNVNGQAPKGFNFQGIALDSAGFVIANKTINLRYTISSDSNSVKINYQETNTATTDKFGQFTQVIGTSNNFIGSFDSIPWSSGSVYLKTEIDITNAGIFKQVGLSKLLSVPFALYSSGSANSVPYIGAIGPVNLGANDLTVNELIVGRGNKGNISNTVIGVASLANNTTGFNNTAVGFNTLKNTTTGFYSSALGANALTNNTTGTDNDAFGNNAMRDNTVGSVNVALGGNALLKNITGIRNVALGHAAHEQNLKGSNNLIIGSYAAQNLIDGKYNVILGDNAAQSWKSGSNNIVIGSNVGNATLLSNLNNKLLIDVKATNTPLIFGSFDSSYLTINGNLNVTGKLSFANNPIFQYGANSSDTININSDVDVFELYDGAWNPVVGLPVPNVLNQQLKNRTATLLLIKCNSSFSTKILSLNTNLNADLTLKTGEFVLFEYSGSKWLHISGKGNITNAAEILTDAYSNTKVGASALLNPKPITTTGNVAVGDSALKYSTGLYNTAIGSKSMLKNINGASNTVVGNLTLNANTTGSNNTALGYISMKSNTSGYMNTALGYASGSANTTGVYNVFLGSQAGNNPIFATVNDKLIIDNRGSATPLIYGDFGNKKIRFNADIDSLSILNRITFQDENANSHIAKYDTGFASPLLYARYFYGHYGDLVLQGMSKVYTGNIHFVTGSNMAGFDPPTQRMVIMDNGKVGIGDFLTGQPRSKLEVKNGDVYISDSTKGMILTAPNGSCWRVTIDNTGNFIRTSISCPVY